MKKLSYNSSIMIADLTENSLWSDASTESSLLKKVLARIDAEPARVRTDANGLIVEINPAFTQLCGYRFTEIQGRKPGSMLQGKETTPESIEILRQAINDQIPCTVEMINYHKNTSKYSVLIEFSPLWSISGDLEGFEAVERKIA